MPHRDHGQAIVGSVVSFHFELPSLHIATHSYPIFPHMHDHIPQHIGFRRQ